MIVFTASYEGRTLDDFLAALKSHGIRTLADVREMPISRKRGFAKSALSTALADEGITYHHLRALGCPKPIRDAYRQDKDWARYTEAFMAHLRQQQPSVDALATLCVEAPTALLCFEADFNRCHRTYVARAVVRQAGGLVHHITENGIVEDEAGATGTPTSHRQD
jgi:uncharacterized protein (DUF488 family)